MRSDQFQERHIGPNSDETKAMLHAIGNDSLEHLISNTIPASIRLSEELDLPEALSEHEYLRALKKIAQKNKVYRSFIGKGYYGTLTPSVILRNIFENPGWYTQYTPYQAEIAQGRLEALLNFQTMVCDLTGMPLANASLLDEGTSAAEAMIMAYNLKNKRTSDRKKIFVDQNVFDQTIDVVLGRAIPLGIEVIVGDWRNVELDADFFAAIVQYPDAIGQVNEYSSFASRLAENDQMVIVAADIMSLTMLKPPGEWGADIVVGTTQRFGIPMGFGGPHAAFFATSEKYKRQIPGRIIGVSKDRLGDVALRMALQTREQHIKREKATSNICTAQALLAIMASMYACYHGPNGIRKIGETIHGITKNLHLNLKGRGYNIINDSFFDTLTIELQDEEKDSILKRAEEKEINYYYQGTTLSISIDETVTDEDIEDIIYTFDGNEDKGYSNGVSYGIPSKLSREVDYLQHPVFSSYHTETTMMRYIKSLENKDLSLVHSMIPLGSCTMKLNAATELIPVSWPEFSAMHPFAPVSQTMGYQQIFDELSKYLAVITGFAGCTLQPNSGAQGEFAGLMVIKAYHESRGDHHRNICLIPSSAHGTNPASAVMAGMKVVVTKSTAEGNIDVDDLREKAELHKNELSALMVTYPSTHGVYESAIKDITKIIHDNGGQVYMDGANMNAQVGLTNPGRIGADVCHLNLHKTFAIPHGGGGPGVGPICVAEQLVPFLPGNPVIKTGGTSAISAISAAPFGSALACLISYGYIKMLGAEGLTESTKIAILNANYIKYRLEGYYDTLYSGERGRAAHEMIIDCRPFKANGIEVTDIAKRLMDYGFHAPTVSFPVAGTMMIEPTESESKAEIDRFCDAMIAIKHEIDTVSKEDPNNVLKNAPHTLEMLTRDEWYFPYSREKAAFPLDYIRANKFWPSVRRVDDAFGDRNLMCTCTPIEAYAEA